MKKWLNCIIVFVFVFMFTPNIQALESVPCGVDYSQNDTMIKADNAELCEKDIMKSVINLVFGTLTTNDDLRYLFTDNPDIPRNVEVLAKTGDVADKIYLLLSSLSILGFAAVGTAAVVLICQRIFSMANGNAEMNNKPKDMTIFIKQLAACILFAPAYGVNIITLLVIAAQFQGASIATYFYSSLLSNHLVNSTQVEVPMDILFNQAEIDAIETVKTGLGITRTTQQLLNQNFVINSYFNEDFQDGDTGVSFDDYEEKIRECMTPYIRRSVNQKTGHHDGFFIENPDKSYCLEEFSEGTIGAAWDATTGNLVSHRNDPKTYGNPHLVMSVKYNTPDFAQMFHNQDGMVNNISQVMTGEDDVEGTAEDLVDKYKTNSFFRPFKEANYSLIYDLLDTSEKDFPEAETQFMNKIALQADVLAERIYNDISDASDIQNQNEIFKANAIYAKTLSIYNSLNGLNSLGDDDTYRLDGTEDHKYGYLYLLDEGKKAADYLEQAHCAKQYSVLTQSLKTQIGLTNLSIDPTNDDLVETVLLDQIPSRSFECLKITGTEYNDTKSSRDYEFKYNIDNSSIDPLSIFDLGRDTSREIFGFNDIYTTFEAKSFNSNEDKRRFMNELHSKTEQHYIDSKREADKYKLVLKAYYFYVKRATMIALGKALKGNTDVEGVVELRQLGFGGAGAFMIKMSMSGGNSSKMVNEILAAYNIQNYINDVTYVVDEAFLSKTAVNKETDLEQSQYEANQLTPFIANGYFSTGQLHSAQSAQIATQTEQDERTSSYIQRSIEAVLFSSFDYVKQANGFDVNRTMGEGLEACKNGTGACKGDVSALAGFVQTGHALNERAIQFYMLQAVLNTLNNIVNDDGDGLMATFKKLGGGVFAIVKVVVGAVLQFITGIVNAIAPLFPVMLAVGIFTAYVLPSFPFFIYSIMCISWVLLGITTCIVIQIQLAKAIMTTESQANEILSFKFFWETFSAILLKPTFMVFSITIVTALAEISLFYVNSVYGYFMAATNAEGIITSIFVDMMSLIIYLLLSGLLIMWAYKQMPTIVDQTLEQIGIRSNDSQTIINSGMIAAAETYVGGAVAKNISSAAQKGVSAVDKKSLSYMEKIREKEEAEAAEFKKKLALESGEGKVDDKSTDKPNDKGDAKE